MDVHDLSADAVARMARADLATLERRPDSLIEPFDFHGCNCGVASFVGQPPWELHNGGDELIHVLAGETELTILTNDREDTRRLTAGDLVIVPQGCWHRNRAEAGVTLLFMTPREGAEHTWHDPRRRP